jgi:hypothetical protein
MIEIKKDSSARRRECMTILPTTASIELIL